MLQSIEQLKEDIKKLKAEILILTKEINALECLERVKK